MSVASTVISLVTPFIQSSLKQSDVSHEYAEKSSLMQKEYSEKASLSKTELSNAEELERAKTRETYKRLGRDLGVAVIGGLSSGVGKALGNSLFKKDNDRDNNKPKGGAADASSQPVSSTKSSNQVPEHITRLFQTNPKLSSTVLYDPNEQYKSKIKTPMFDFSVPQEGHDLWQPASTLPGVTLTTMPLFAL